MTTEERNIKLKHLITCMKCEVSGKVCDENCPTQYEAGNMGEIVENLEAISEILEQNEKLKKALDKIREEIEDIPNNPSTKPVGTYDYVMGATNERRIILEIIDKYRR